MQRSELYEQKGIPKEAKIWYKGSEINAHAKLLK